MTGTTRATVGVAMATYNGQRYLEPQLDSILSQTRCPDRIILVDDHSTDGTAALLSAYQSRYPDRITVTMQPRNLGPQATFARAIAVADTDYVALCDQDDIWLPEKIDVMVGALQARPEAGMCFHDMAIIDPEGRLRAASFWRVAPPHEPLPVTGVAARRRIARWSNPVPGCSMMLSRSLVEHVLPFPESVVGHDWWISAVAFFTMEPFFLPQQLTHYRRHPDQAAGIGMTLEKSAAEKQKLTGSQRLRREVRRILVGPWRRRYQRRIDRIRRECLAAELGAILARCLSRSLPEKKRREYLALHRDLGGMADSS